MSNDKELLIVAGLPQSGTTWLEEILNAHPYISLEHEIDDLNSADSSFSTINHKINQETESGYRDALIKGVENVVNSSKDSSKKDTHLVGFKTVGRFTHPTVFSWMRKTLEYPKTIFIIRHPCGYAASQLRFPSLKNLTHQEIIENRKWYIESLNREVKDGISLEKFHSLLWQLTNELILNDNINTKNFHCIIYENLCKSPMVETQKIMEFLEIPIHKKVTKYLQKSTNPNRNVFAKLLSKRFYSTTKNPMDSAMKWKKELNEKQILEIQSELEHSSIMKYWKPNKINV